MENILEQHKFTYKRSSIAGHLSYCYERCIPIGTYFAWIAVNVETGDVVIYVECNGNEIETYTDAVYTPWDEDPDGFFKELDTYVTSQLKQYIQGGK